MLVVFAFFINMTREPMDLAYYQALANAETGGESNPWIRTKFRPEGGSTAFGPVQITKGLIELVFDKLSPQSQKFVTDVMIPMQELFSKYGAEPEKEGYDPKYDYGGTGGFDVQQYGDAYRQLANELMIIGFKDMEERGIDNTIDNFLKWWKGNTPNKEYRDRFMKKFPRSHYKK